MRVVLDTNSLLASISKKSKYRPIFDGILRGKFTLLMSNEILSEYTEVIERKASPVVAANISELLVQAKHVEKIEIFFKWLLLFNDEDDDKFVDCAVSGKADFIVTDDKHFNTLKNVKFPAIKVIKTQDFLEIILALDSK